MLDIHKGAVLSKKPSITKLLTSRKLFAKASKNNESKDPSQSEEPITLESLLSKKMGELSIAYKKSFRSNGYWALRDIIDSPELTRGENKPDPKNGCYAGQQYSLPLSLYFMRSSILRNTQDLQEIDRDTKNSLYLKMCEDITSGPLRRQLKEIPGFDSDDPNFPFFPPQSIVEEISDKALNNLIDKKYAPKEPALEEQEPG